LVIEVTYQTTAVAAKKYSQLRRTEFFESSTLPDTPTIIKQLSDMRKDFAEDTVLVSEHQMDDTYTLRSKGFRITQL
jgi:hypothetical protein